MGIVINFKKASKKVAKTKKEKLASEKRAKHGQKKLTRTLIKKKKKTLKIHLDDHKMDDTDNKG